MCLFPQLFPFFQILIRLLKIHLYVYMQSMHVSVGVCLAWVQLVERWYLLA